MKVIDVYQQYFKAEACFHETERHGASVMLSATSDEGNIRYEAAVSFFPHSTEEDFAVSYDAYFSKVLYEGKGRRSRKREEGFLESLREEIDALAEERDAVIYWEEPLREARRG